ncbi:MAG TPA: hypothetical protein VLB44_03355 [Kofleriaceae bacterium]|nr:hypothetical protein [Kofleriaceae bacterium]
MMRASIATLLVLGCAAGCTDNTYMIVTVDKRPAVHEAAKLKVTLSNAGSMRTDDLDLAGKMFPVTFSLTAPGRGGEIGLSIDALDTNGALVGRGLGQATLSDMTAQVILDSADFVVNTDYANNQFLSSDFEAVGLQLSATSNGTWTTVFRDDCSNCDIYGRRFDATGLPVQSQLAAGTNQFRISTTQTTSGAIPSVSGGLGTSGLTTLVLWDYFDTVGTGQGVACRALNDMGGGTPGQVSTVLSESTDVVTSAALGNGNFVVTWQNFQSAAPAMEVIRSVIVKPDCNPLASPFTVSQSTQSLGHRRSHVAANGTSLLYVWVADDSVYVRPAPNTGTPLGAERPVITKTSTMSVEHVRVAPYGTGYAIAVRWSAVDGTSPGKIEVYRTDASGNVQGTPTRISDNSGSDFASDKAFGLATRADGALLVVWHTCPTGPGSCDVFGRVMRPTGVPVGPEFMIPTATGSDQVNPSVVALDSAFVAAWNDSSGLDPDRSGSAVRARVLYPPYDDARAVLGATCGASAPGAPACGPGLACAMGTDQVQRCYETCTPPACPNGGTCSTIDAATSACTF